MIRIVLPLLIATFAAACSQPQYLLAEGDTPIASRDLPAAGSDTPIAKRDTPEPGAKAPVVAAIGPQAGPDMYNSDNKPIISRTGINSDPRNPSGAPASPRAWYEI